MMNYIWHQATEQYIVIKIFWKDNYMILLLKINALDNPGGLVFCSKLLRYLKSELM